MPGGDNRRYVEEARAAWQLLHRGNALPVVDAMHDVFEAWLKRPTTSRRPTGYSELDMGRDE